MSFRFCSMSLRTRSVKSIRRSEKQSNAFEPENSTSAQATMAFTVRCMSFLTQIGPRGRNRRRLFEKQMLQKCRDFFYVSDGDTFTHGVRIFHTIAKIERWDLLFIQVVCIGHTPVAVHVHLLRFWDDLF